MISDEQATEVKKQILQQIESTFPPETKEMAKSNVLSMNNEQLEEFLKKNNLMANSQKSGGVQGEGKCIFCSIIDNEMSSYILDENKDFSAILEINPISEGHTIIIPKKHSLLKEKLPKNLTSFIEKISKKLKAKLKPKNILQGRANLFGHEIINLVPVYNDETLNSERHKAEKEELENLFRTLTKKPKIIMKKHKLEKIDEKKLWLPKRIP